MAKNRNSKSKSKSPKSKAKVKAQAAAAKIIKETPVAINYDSFISQSETSEVESVSLASEAESDITSINTEASPTPEPTNAYPKVNINFASEALEFPAPAFVSPPLPVGAFTFQPRKIALPKSRVKEIVLGGLTRPTMNIPENEKKLEMSVPVTEIEGDEKKVEMSVPITDIQANEKKVEISAPAADNQLKEENFALSVSGLNHQESVPKPDIEKATGDIKMVDICIGLVKLSKHVEGIASRVDVLPVAVDEMKKDNAVTFAQLEANVEAKFQQLQSVLDRLSEQEKMTKNIEATIEERLGVMNAVIEARSAQHEQKFKDIEAIIQARLDDMNATIEHRLSEQEQKSKDTNAAIEHRLSEQEEKSKDNNVAIEGRIDGLNATIQGRLSEQEQKSKDIGAAIEERIGGMDATISTCFDNMYATIQDRLTQQEEMSNRLAQQEDDAKNENGGKKQDGGKEERKLKHRVKGILKAGRGGGGGGFCSVM